MVGTRNHPKDFDEPQIGSASSSPRKRATRTSTVNHATPIRSASPPPTPTKTSRAVMKSQKSGWSHTPSNMTLIWLAISLPLVIWDSGYVLLRPYSMPGGKLHSPIWKPYGYYGTVDHTYGFKAWDARLGWTAAQGSFNVLETLGYFVYLYIVYTYGEQEPKQGSGAPDKSTLGSLRALGESRTVYGKYAAWSTLLCFSVASLTFWKTVLYWVNEAFSGELYFV